MMIRDDDSRTTACSLASERAGTSRQAIDAYKQRSAHKGCKVLFGPAPKKNPVLENIEIIKHIPHASTEFPPFFNRRSCKISFGFNDFDKYLYKMADLFVDKLFQDIPGIELKAKYSRLYCDVERFKDDDKEPMSKLGQGYIYQKGYDGKDFIRFKKFNDIDIVDEINKYYENHHKKLNNLTKQIINRGKDVLILDLHSFSDEQARYLGKEEPFPDICIGIVEPYFKQEILDLIIEKIKERGFSYQINYPYEGSIVPSDVLNGKIKGNIYSFMIEVNKRLYL